MTKGIRDFNEDFVRRQEARTALPRWFRIAHVLIFVASLAVSLVALLATETSLYAYLHPGHGFRDAPRTTQKIMMFAMLPGILGPAFVIANSLEWAIKPMRDIWNRTFQGIPGTRFADARRVTAWLVGVTVISLLVSYFVARAS